MKSRAFTLDLAGKKLIAEFSDLAEHANRSILLKYGETAILVTAVMGNRENSGMDYFPLSVEFEEKFYAAGQILGSRFMRREGRPSDEAILSARVVDRTIRPLFNQYIRREVQVVITVLAMGEDDTGIQEITTEEDRTVFITSKNGTANVAADQIRALTKVYVIGKKLSVTIPRLAAFDTFTKLDSFNEDLIHISEIAPLRIETMEDILEEGEIVSVVVSKIENGKIGLSIKQADPEFAEKRVLKPSINTLE